jgi:hypothetical protein
LRPIHTLEINNREKIYHRNCKEELTLVIISEGDNLVCNNSNKAISDLMNYLAKHLKMKSSAAKHEVELPISRNRKKNGFKFRRQSTQKRSWSVHINGNPLQ